MDGNRAHNSNRSGEYEAAGCPDFETLSVYFDRELTEPEMVSVKQHVATCERCTAVLGDFGLLRGALLATTPAARARSLTISAVSEKRAPISLEPRRISSLYPVFTAIAAVLVLALIAGNFLASTGSNPPAAPTVSGAVIVIDGTPFTADDNDAEFGAASADVMNGEADTDAVTAAGTEPDESLLTYWNIALLIAVVALGAIGGLWARDRNLMRR